MILFLDSKVQPNWKLHSKKFTKFKVAPLSIYEHPRYRAQVRIGNLVNLA